MFKYRQKNHTLKLSLKIAIVFLLFTKISHAAILGIYPSSNIVTVGKTFSAKVLVGANGLAVNNAEGTVSYPTDLLDVVSVSKNSSIFNLWFDEPSFSNIIGEVNFNGGLPSPGYSGNAGEVVTILFRAKKVGSASLVMKNSAVRANDGQGTNVLQSVQNIAVTINPEVREPETDQVSDSRIPAKPILSSPSHPDQNLWSKNNTVTFNWKAPSDVESVKTLFNNKSFSDPTVSYDRSVSERTFSSVSDGVYYFHIRYTNSFGSSPIVHYRVNVDTVPPDKFSIPIEELDGRNLIKLDAKDITSGIDNYLIKIDDQSSFRVSRSDLDQNSNFILPVLNNGAHNIKVTAFDLAGNSTDASNSYTSTSILAPTISVLSKDIVKGNSIELSGLSHYPDTNVNIKIKGSKDNKIYAVTTDKDGNFKLKTTSIYSDGTVELSAEMMFSQTVKSPVSNVITVNVRDSAVVNTSKSVIYTMSFVIPALVTILLALITIYLGWHKFFGLKKKIRREVKIVKNSVHKEMMEFKNSLIDELEKLEILRKDRTLSSNEQKFVANLKKTIDNIDRIVEKKIEEIK